MKYLKISRLERCTWGTISTCDGCRNGAEKYAVFDQSRFCIAAILV